MCSSLRGRFDTLFSNNTDIISSLQISQHQYRHLSLAPNVATSTQTLQHITVIVTHRRHRTTTVAFAPSM
jgi:hypothetical protein